MLDRDKYICGRAAVRRDCTMADDASASPLAGFPRRAWGSGPSACTHVPSRFDTGRMRRGAVDNLRRVSTI